MRYDMERVKVRFKKLHPNAKAPFHGSEFAAGYDLYAIEKETDSIHDVVVYHTGLALEIPQGFVGLLFPRSSIYKLHLRSSLSVGVVDSDYRGEVRIIYDGRKVFDVENQYQIGDRVGQLVITRIPEVDFEEAAELSVTARGAGGYGSTGGFTEKTQASAYYTPSCCIPDALDDPLDFQLGTGRVDIRKFIKSRQ